MSNWDALAAKDSPREEEIKQQKKMEEEHRNRYKRCWVNDYNWDLRVDGKFKGWNYECQRMYAVLGFKVASKELSRYERSAGPTELRQTSTGSYEIRGTTNVKKWYHYVLEVDSSKIIDVEKYDKIKKEYEAFLWDAEKKFGSPVIGEEPVVPAFFRLEETFIVKYQDEYNTCPRLLKAIFYPLYQAGAKKFYKNYTQKHVNYIPLVNAYFEQVKAFEEEIKKIANFD